LVATFSGVMSASMSFGVAAGDPIKELTKFEFQTGVLWEGLPVLVIVLLGGFTTNFIWCVLLNIRNKTGYQYLSGTTREPMPRREDETIIETAIDAPSEEVVEHIPGAKKSSAKVPLGANYFFCALAGTTWYMQFFFYTMGESQMGESLKFSSWTIHMASIIIFSTLWGIGLREWKGASPRTVRLLTAALAVLVASTVIVGYGNYLKPEKVDGVIVRIHEGNLVVENEDGKKTMVGIGAEDALTIDGKSGKVGELKPSQTISIRREPGGERKIEVQSPTAGK
jgi:L-rhamnose-H+ transport protein